MGCAAPGETGDGRRDRARRSAWAAPRLPAPGEPAHGGGAPLRGGPAPDGLGGILRRCVLQRVRLSLPPITVGGFKNWDVDTRGDGSEFLAGWVDHAAQTFNRSALLELIKQVKTGGDPHDRPLLLHATAALERTKPWVVFGLDGRVAQDVDDAVAIGNRRFDCAESYANTSLLANAIKKHGLRRDQYDVFYKFDVRPSEKPAQLATRLTSVCEMFDGRLEGLLIHNLDVAPDAIVSAWATLIELKRSGRAGKIGVGNIRSHHGTLLEQLARAARIDIVENPADSGLLDENVFALLAETGAELLTYNVVMAAKAIGLTERPQLKDLVASLGARHTVILSSGDRERRRQNLADFATNPMLDKSPDAAPGNEETAFAIYTWTEAARKPCNDNEELALPEGLVTCLTALARDQGAAAAEQLRKLAAGAPTRTTILEWITATFPVRRSELETAKVPSRTGLKRRFAGMPLLDVLMALFGASSCNRKWATELVQMLVTPLKDWELILRPVAENITE